MKAIHLRVVLLGSWLTSNRKLSSNSLMVLLWLLKLPGGANREVPFSVSHRVRKHGSTNLLIILLNSWVSDRELNSSSGDLVDVLEFLGGEVVGKALCMSHWVQRRKRMYSLASFLDRITGSFPFINLLKKSWLLLLLLLLNSEVSFGETTQVNCCMQRKGKVLTVSGIHVRQKHGDCVVCV